MRRSRKYLLVHGAFVLILLGLGGFVVWRSYLPVLLPEWVDRTRLAPFERGGQWGYVNGAGQWAIPARFDAAKQFIGDRALVQKDGLWGWVDRFGEWATPHRFDKVGFPGPGALAVVTRNGKQGYVNERGDLVIDTVYDKADPFCDGLAGVNLNGNCGYIDETGRMAIEPVFTGGHPFIPGTGLAFVHTNGIPVVIDRRGRIVLEPEFVRFSVYPPFWLSMRGATWIGSYRDGLAPFNVGGHIHTANSIDRASAALGGKWGYINQKLEVVVEPRFDWPGGFDRGVAEVVLGGKRVRIDMRGNVLTDPEVEAVRRAWEVDERLKLTLWHQNARVRVCEQIRVEVRNRTARRPTSSQSADNEIGAGTE